eukprot:Ihof_evm18s10 gene=Ihof_evmTU18s10
MSNAPVDFRLAGFATASPSVMSPRSPRGFEEESMRSRSRTPPPSPRLHSVSANQTSPHRGYRPSSPYDKPMKRLERRGSNEMEGGSRLTMVRMSIDEDPITIATVDNPTIFTSAHMESYLTPRSGRLSGIGEHRAPFKTIDRRRCSSIMDTGAPSLPAHVHSIHNLSRQWIDPEVEAYSTHDWLHSGRILEMALRRKAETGTAYPCALREMWSEKSMMINNGNEAVGIVASIGCIPSNLSDNELTDSDSENDVNMAHKGLYKSQAGSAEGRREWKDAMALDEGHMAPLSERESSCLFSTISGGE